MAPLPARAAAVLTAALLGPVGCAQLSQPLSTAPSGSDRAHPGARTAEAATSPPRPRHPAASVRRYSDRYVPDLIRGREPGPWARLRGGFELPSVAEPRVAAEIERYAGRQGYFEAVARRAEPYMRHLLERIEARGMPSELLLVPIVESAFRPFAYSHARAGGLWQFKPRTASHYGLTMNWWYDGRRDIVAGTEAALDYFAYLHDFFDGDWLLAIAAYNAGEGTIRQAQRANRRAGEPTDYWHLDLPQQTELYVPRVLALREVLQRPRKYGLNLPALDADRALALVDVQGQIDLARAADWAGVSIETLYRYNPGLNRWATPPDGPHRLAVPAKAAPRLRQALAKRDTSQLVKWRRHEVRPGDTLNELANAYDTTVASIRKANGLGGDVIRVGQHLVVPTASRTQQAYVLSGRNRRRNEQASGPSGRERVAYRVESGDTLWAVAQAYGVPVRRLAEWNGMAPSDPLQPGDRLVVWLEPDRAARGGPEDRVQRVDYTVQRGDSLSRIAQRFDVDVADIRRWNDLDDAVLQPGQRLTLRVDVTAQSDAS